MYGPINTIAKASDGYTQQHLLLPIYTAPPVSAKPSFAVILRRYRQSPYSRASINSQSHRVQRTDIVEGNAIDPQFSPGSTHAR